MKFRLEDLIKWELIEAIESHIKKNGFRDKIEFEISEFVLVIILSESKGQRKISFIISAQRVFLEPCVFDFHIGSFTLYDLIEPFTPQSFEIGLNNLHFRDSNDIKILISSGGIVPISHGEKPRIPHFQITVSNSNVAEIKISGHFDAIKIEHVDSLNKVELSHLECTSISISDINKKTDRDVSIYSTLCNSKTLIVENSRIRQIIVDGLNSGTRYQEYTNNSIDSVILSDGYLDYLKLSGNDIKYFKIDNINEGFLLFEENNFGKFSLLNLNFKLKNKLRMSDFKNHEVLRFFAVDNTIKSFYSLNVSWNYNSLLDREIGLTKKNLKNGEENLRLRLILFLKQLYASQKDTFNERLFEAFEKRWYFENRSFNFPLWISWVSNSFGLSLRKPLFWVLITFLLECTLLTLLTYPDKEILLQNWGVFVNILNPTHKTDVFLVVFENNNAVLSSTTINLFYLCDNLFRIIIGYFLFQFISAFRYKYNLR